MKAQFLHKPNPGAGGIAALMLGALLAALTAVLYAPAVFNSFVLYDVFDYLLDNSTVQRGITCAGVHYAFSTFQTGDWQPITWLSWMAECSLFGLNPSVSHGINVLLHGLNSCLLFVFLFRVSQAKWKSFAAAALFAIHPIHVESVVWAAGRKDTLSTFFFLLTLHAYASYRYGSISRGAKTGFYILALAAYGIGLMAKPMIVTLPFLLLLLDRWVFSNSVSKGREFGWGWSSKIPFLILSLASCGMAWAANQSAGGIMTVEAFPVSVRLANAAFSYARYLGQLLWPARLSFFYPHAGNAIFSAESLFALMLIAALTIAAVLWRKSHPYFFSGWFWYLGSLIPVIGLIQVGSQAMADRYAYIPFMGLYWSLVWGIADLLSRIKLFFMPLKYPVGAAGIFLAVLLGFATSRQIQVWKNDVSLNEHALKLHPDNSAAHTNLGFYYEREGDLQQASYHYQRSLQSKPAQIEVMNNLGVIYLRQGDREESAALFKQVLKSSPDHPKANFNLGLIASQQKDYRSAEGYLLTVLKNNPQHLKSLIALAQCYLAENQKDKARIVLEKALQTAPEDEDVNYLAGNLALQSEDFDAAKMYYARVMRINPNHARAAHNLASLYFYEKDYPQAVAYYQKTVELEPGLVAARINLGKTYIRSQDWDRAAEQFRWVSEQYPDYPEAKSLLKETLEESRRQGHSTSSYYLKNL